MNVLPCELRERAEARIALGEADAESLDNRLMTAAADRIVELERSLAEETQKRQEAEAMSGIRDEQFRDDGKEIIYLREEVVRLIKEREAAVGDMIVHMNRRTASDAYAEELKAKARIVIKHRPSEAAIEGSDIYALETALDGENTAAQGASRTDSSHSEGASLTSGAPESPRALPSKDGDAEGSGSAQCGKRLSEPDDTAAALAEQLIEAALDTDASGRPEASLADCALALRAALSIPSVEVPK
jgi:hypothetical protein